MNVTLNELKELAKDKRFENKKYFEKLKKKPPKNLDYIMQELHETQFKKTDCLTCANCCKTTGPLFTKQDISRISKYLKIKEQEFEYLYLKIDEEKDKILNKLPCHFLNVDNTCSIYDVRPKACREFPHTDRTKFYQIANLTMENVGICPAAFSIVERLKEKVKF